MAPSMMFLSLPLVGFILCYNPASPALLRFCPKPLPVIRRSGTSAGERRRTFTGAFFTAPFPPPCYSTGSSAAPLLFALFCSVPSASLHMFLDCSLVAGVLPTILRFAAGFCTVLHTAAEYLSLVPDPLRSTAFLPSARHCMCRFLFVFFKWTLFCVFTDLSPLPLPVAQHTLASIFFRSFLHRANLEYFAAARTHRHAEFFRVWDPGGDLYVLVHGILRWRRAPWPPPAPET